MKQIPAPSYDSPDEHSEYSPSGSKRWLSCPASIQMLRGIPKVDKEPSFFAEEGTAAHELGAYCLDHEVSCETQLNKEYNKFIVDKEMARQTQKYVDYVNGQVAWDAVLWVENRLSLESVYAGMFGTADAIIYSESMVEVIDLKYGKGIVVEAEDNTQLMLYALGTLLHLGSHGLKYADGFDVKLTIVQPRAHHAQGPVRSTYVTIAQLKDFRKLVINAIAETKKKEPDFGPGEEQCRWCEAGPVCKAYAHYNLEVAQLEFADFAKPAREFKQSFVDKNSLSNEQLSQILVHNKAIQTWLNSITEYAIEQLKNDKPVNGFKLVYGRSNRAWENPELAITTLLDYGTDPERLYIKKFLSPAQSEKELTQTEFDLIKDIIFKPQGKITIAPESDGRLAVNTNKEAKDDWAGEV